ncbi:MAG: terminase small subunit [Thiotrichaceae bacterium]|nr:terminase small subunit [Thiotrichaceae bacterium]
MELTTKLETFAIVLAETDDQAEAYRAMVPNTKAKPESIWVSASRFANDPKVKLRVAELKAIAKKIAEDKFEITQERVLLEIARLAFHDPRKVFDADNNMLSVQDWPDEVAAAISSIKVIETKTGDKDTVSQLKEIKFWDKGKQIELAAKKLGMLTDKLKVEVDDNVDRLSENELVNRIAIANARIKELTT